MLSKLLTAVAAVAAVLATAPAANANVDQIMVGVNTGGTHPVTASATTLDWWIGATQYTCASPAASGTAEAGFTPAPNPWMAWTGTTFAGCTGAFPDLDLELACGLEVDWLATASVTSALTDTAVVNDVTIPCLRAEDVFGGFLCSFDIVGNGTHSAVFDEITQELTISVGGLTAQFVSGCFGQVSNGTVISLDATFAIGSNNGSINLMP